MIRRNTLIVLVVFLVLLGAIMYINFNPELQVKVGMTTATPTEQPRIIGSYPIDSVVNIKYTDEQGGITEIIKDADGDWITIDNQPVSVAAWFQIFQFLNELRSIGQLDGNTPLEKAGLDPARSSLSFTDKDGKTTLLLIGNLAASQTAYYVKWNDGPAAMVDSNSLTQITNLFNPQTLVEPTPTIQESLPTQTSESK
ncbi:MAG: DUF4340 domain-containing protein [Anaerolineae bacterium]|nr:DUF4340 domain-containing protein [Anaerolineae bacterium]